MRQAAHYDREAGIVYIGITPRSRRRRRDQPTTDEVCSWGLIVRAERSREIVAVEMWRPKEMLPPDLLEAMPPPTWTRREVVAQTIRGHLDRAAWKLWRQRKFERWRSSPEGLAAQAQERPPQRWYRGLPALPEDPEAASEYRRRHPDVK